MSQGTRAKSRLDRRRSGNLAELNMPLDVRVCLSNEDFIRLCQANPDLRLERSARGELIVMAPVGTEGGGRNAKLTIRLRVGVWAGTDGTGEYFDSSTGFRLPNGAIRSPDTSWIRKERWNALPPEQKRHSRPSPLTLPSSCVRRPTRERTFKKRCVNT